MFWKLLDAVFPPARIREERRRRRTVDSALRPERGLVRSLYDTNRMISDIRRERR